MKRLLLMVLGFAGFGVRTACAQLLASATWDQASGGNGHRYELHKVSAGLDWTSARDAAVAAGGYLATCATAAENAFVFALVNDVQAWTLASHGRSIGPWIGGFQAPGSPEPAGGWQWISGETWSVANWAVGEPNNSCFSIEEHTVCYWNQDMLTAPLPASTWNDYAGCVGPVIAYVIEYDFTAFCFGDGSGSACPCANNGAIGNGCANSVFAVGSNLRAMGQPRVASDTVTLSATGMTGSLAIFFQGASQTAAVVIDDGIGCVGGPIVRIASKPITSGVSSYPESGDVSISVRGAIPVAGGTFYYQTFYRNAAAAFCPPATANRTNGIAVPWAP